ncbi:uncharacterized protein PAC_02095 [Phialocephala subalpina]|uniref:Integral membrane protein n=1 Tax=Phialocephala subalpina TaxID=576137 RepID=A0A1L7WHG5_9HELO|nr:uncharacterized protein PAC_02095 [Phialocephala subalpina]
MLLNDRFSLLLLLSLVSPSTSVTLDTLGILPITYQSKGISFSEWVSLLTLCVTPLLAHIIAGIPDIVCLSVPRKHLSWHQRLCQYNPTTIIWRYFAITDRRIRAKNWDANTLAASNALFWTRRGWDGSEAMIQSSRKYCIKPPDSTRIGILSKSFFKTIIVTIQGVQAAILLVGGFTSRNPFTTSLSISSIFFPLAVLGLLRLCAAPWLTDDFIYVENEQHEAVSTPVTTSFAEPENEQGVYGISPAPRVADTEYSKGWAEVSQNTTSIPMTPFRTRTTSYEGLANITDSNIQSSFRPTNSWCGRLFRVFFLIPTLLLWVVCVMYMVPWSTYGPKQKQYLTATLFILNITYLVFLSATLFTYTYYFIRGRSATTVIPCIFSLWYFIYTVVLLAMMLLLVIVAAIETRKTPCGIYTSWPGDVCDGIYLNSTATDEPFGIALRYVAPMNVTQLPEGEFRIVEWDGWCTGREGKSQLVKAVNGSQ